MPVNVNTLRIILYPDPRLRRQARPVVRFDDELVRVADRMVHLMKQEKGVGLAAPQVGLAWRLFVCQPAEQDGVQIYVNPTLTLGPEEEVKEEGCLSIPEVTVNIRRAIQCEISAFDPHGRPIHASSEGMPARVWQHEFDHLEGRLITERMTEAEKIENRKLLKQLEKDYEKSRGKR